MFSSIINNGNIKHNKGLFKKYVQIFLSKNDPSPLLVTRSHIKLDPSPKSMSHLYAPTR